MAKKNQSERLTRQHKESHGEIGIFGAEAKEHDVTVGDVAQDAMKFLETEYPQLQFRFRKELSKKEINDSLKKSTNV